MAASLDHSTDPTTGRSAKKDLWRRNTIFRNILPFAIGGVSGTCATVCVQPLDMVKIRLQLSDQGARSTASPSSLIVARSILLNDGFRGFYQGLSAAVARQVVYGTSRLGLFIAFEDYLKSRARRDNGTYGFAQRTFASICAGGLGAAIGNPTEVALIRMQSDGLRPVHQRENFRSVVDAIVRITRREGLRALWSGCSPTVVRAISTNFGQLAFFSESKHQLEKYTNWSPGAQTLTASAIGGFAAAFFSAPTDFVKSRLQSQSRLTGGHPLYRGMVACFLDVARREGLTRFYRGFPAYFLRMAPHSVISLVIMDQLCSMLR